MCIAKLDYEVSIVGYKDFSAANTLTPLSIKFFPATYRWQDTPSGFLCGIQIVTERQFPIERKGGAGIVM